MVTVLLLAALLPAAALVVLGVVGAKFIIYDPTRLPHTVFPEQFGLPYEKVEFPNPDGQTLRGWIIPAAKPTGRTILLCHGWGANKGHILEETRFLRERGFDLFYFDFRGCGESDGEVGSIGYLEARDFDAALAYLRDKRPGMVSRLGVFGQSMGGAVAMIGAVRHPVFKAALIESCYLSYNQVLPTYSKAKWGIPDLFLFSSIRWWIRRFLKADPEVLSPAYFVDKLGRLPVLYLWGTEDRVMPLEWGRALYERTPGPKDLLIFEGGYHGRLWEAAPKLYEQKVGDFFDKHV